MRVLIVSNLFRPVTLGGYERGCAEFADHLVAQGHEVRVLTTDLTQTSEPDPGGLTVHRVLRSYRRLDGSFEQGSVRWRIGVERWNLSALRGLTAAWRPDVLMWWNLGGLSVSLVEAGRRLGLPTCGVVNDYWMEWSADVDPWARLAAKVPGLGLAAERLLGFPRGVDYAAAAHWLFVSDYVRQRTIGVIGQLPRTGIVHSGIDLSSMTARPQTPEWGGRVLIVGRVTRNKGVDIAVDAVAAVPGTSLTICGARDVSLGAELEAQIAATGTRDRVRFIERTTPAQVAPEYAAHDVVVFPARWAEPWGKVPLEAMASGVPVIVSGTGGSAEYSHDEENCLLASTPEEFAAALRRLAADPDLRARLVAGGLATARQFGTGQANDGRLAALKLVVAGAD